MTYFGWYVLPILNGWPVTHSHGFDKMGFGFIGEIRVVLAALRVLFMLNALHEYGDWLLMTDISRLTLPLNNPAYLAIRQSSLIYSTYPSIHRNLYRLWRVRVLPSLCKSASLLTGGLFSQYTPTRAHWFCNFWRS